MSTKLNYTRLLVFKSEAFFVYFTLEAHEGLCSFSTVDLPKDLMQSSENFSSRFKEAQAHQLRCLDIFTDVQNTVHLNKVLKHLSSECDLEIIFSKIIDDQIGLEKSKR